MGVLSGLEMALWDIVGKALDKPVYELLGGKVHERLRSYTYLYPREAKATPTRMPPSTTTRTRRPSARRLCRDGIHGAEIRSGRPLFDLRSAPAEPGAARAFGKVLQDASARPSAPRPICCSARMASSPPPARSVWRGGSKPYDPLWFEEPVPPEMPEEMAHRRAPDHHSRSPPASGCAPSTNSPGVLELRAASIIQMALGRVGGILEAKKIAGMAEAHYAQIAPHLYCGPIEGAANVQLSACIPNFLILESIGTWTGFHADILKKPMQWQDGYVIVPDTPGPRRGTERGRGAGAPVHRHRPAPRAALRPGRRGRVGHDALRLHRPRQSRRQPRRLSAARRISRRRP